jgi:uncharacterized protein
MDIETLAASWRNRMAGQQQRRRQRAEEARGAARRAALVLRREFDVEAVWLFGSLLSGPLHDDFDVDMAVRGLPPNRYYAALARVSDIVGGSVDLVPLESCHQRLRHTVGTTGERTDG